MKKFTKISILFVFCVFFSSEMFSQALISEEDNVLLQKLSINNSLENVPAQLSVGGVVYISGEDTGELFQSKVFDEYAAKYLLFVEQGVLAEDLAIADKSIWLPDYVFEPDYELPSLSEIESYVKANHHLPGIISEAELKEEGIYEVNDMLLGQLKNLEELTLHTIELEKKLGDQNEYIDELIDKIYQLKESVTELEKLAAQCNQ